VVNRKGVYTELADWARPRGHTHLRVDGEFLPTQGFPRIDRFKEHTIELPVGSLDVDAANEASCASAADQALEHGKGVVHVLSRWTACRGDGSGFSRRPASAGAGVFHLRACPVCATSYPELDPRLFSTTASTAGAPTAWAPGVQLTREQRKAFDDSVRDDDQGREQSFAEPEVEDVADVACPGCGGTRLNARRARCSFEGRHHRHRARCRCATCALGRRPAGRRAAERLREKPTSRATCCPRSAAGWSSWRRWAWATSRWTAARPRSAAARRSASAWRRSWAPTCRACATCSTSPPSACTRATTRSCSMRLHKLGDKGNTLVVVEHDEDTIRRADHIIDIGPSAGKRGGRVVAEGSVADS
jgi:excinuclease ABC subunit A